MRPRLRLLALLLPSLLLLSAPAYAQDEVVLTHSASQEIDPSLGVACVNSSTNFHFDNSFWRVFDLTEFGVTGDLEINSVEVGIQTAEAAGDTQPAEVRLYTLDGELLFANLTTLDTVRVEVADQIESLLDIPVTGVTVPAGAVLAVQFYIPDGNPDGNRLFIGFNDAGQTGPTYVFSEECGDTEPTDFATLGFPNRHFVMSVYGDDIGTTANEPGTGLPRSVTLGASYPNPFAATTTLPFTVDEATHVSLAVYDVLGREVAVLTDATYTVGEHTIAFDASSLPSGSYLVRLEANGTVQTRMVTVVE